MIYNKDYYGFVYRWYDKKRSMYYIGSHHGSLTSSYICSSERMLRAYKRRPEDFSREILEFNTTHDDCAVSKELEQVWLDSVPNIKDDPRYYNRKNEAKGGWSFIKSTHVKKRAGTLATKHKKQGLSEAEKNSYKTKIDTRLKRIETDGFTQKEIDQHNAYGYKVKVSLPDGTERTYPSMSKASKDLNIDCQYARIVTLQNRTYKGYQVHLLEEPKIDCRGILK